MKTSRNLAKTKTTIKNTTKRWLLPNLIVITACQVMTWADVLLGSKAQQQGCQPGQTWLQVITMISDRGLAGRAAVITLITARRGQWPMMLRRPPRRSQTRPSGTNQIEICDSFNFRYFSSVLKLKTFYCGTFVVPKLIVKIAQLFNIGPRNFFNTIKIIVKSITKQ